MIARLVWCGALAIVLCFCVACVPLAAEPLAEAPKIAAGVTDVAPAVVPAATATRAVSPTPAATVASQALAVATREPTASPIPTATLVPTTEPLPTPTATRGAVEPVYKIVGYSAEAHPIEAWQLGSGPTHVVFVGGIHGGYEWNTVLLAFQLLDYLIANPALVPPQVTLTIVPVANPDGLERVTGVRGRFTPDMVAENTVRGRFNGDGVDVNRNWDCNWEPTGFWGSNVVSGGTAPFSEGESYYLSQWFRDIQPALVVFWHSKVPGVFLGACNGVTLADSRLYGALYAAASGYPLVEDGFTAYPITGDASDYLATVGIASFTVELETRSSPETDRNLAGLLAVLDAFR